MNKLAPGPASLGVINPLYALVRDKNGRPKIEDGLTMPEWAQKDLLTEGERQTLARNPFAFKPVKAGIHINLKQ